MRKLFIIIVLGCLLIPSATIEKLNRERKERFGGDLAVYQKNRNENELEKIEIESLIDSFKEKKIFYKKETKEWKLVEFKWFDEKIPLSLSFFWRKESKIDKIVYFLPGSGMNFRGNFFTPLDRNLALFFSERGYLVIGITPREDNVIYFFQKCDFMKDWGLKKHKKDIRKVISLIEEKADLPYEILGFSAGAFYALDYAATFYKDLLLKKIIVLDAVGEYDPVKEKDLKEKAEITENAIKNLIEKEKIYVDNSLALLKILILIESLFPYISSGVERINHSGCFTLEGLLYFTAIYTNRLEGPTTKYTNLPENWYYEQGWCNGTYIFKENPRKDIYFLKKTKVFTLKKAALKAKSGIYPYKSLQDIFSVIGGGRNYSIPYQTIRCEVLWINSELGMGNHTFCLKKIKEPNFILIKGYGHADLIYAKEAEKEVWRHIFN